MQAAFGGRPGARGHGGRSRMAVASVAVLVALSVMVLVWPASGRSVRKQLQLSVSANGAAVAWAGGDVYAIENSARRVIQYDASGAFVRVWGWGVQDGSNAFQTCTRGVTSCLPAVAPATPGAAGALAGPQGIAVDQATGNVYVVDQTDQRVNVYGPTGTFQGAFGWGVVDGSSAVQFCTATCLQGRTGALAGQLGSSLGFPAVDPTNGHVLVADRANRRVAEYSVTLAGRTVTGAAFVRAFGWDVANTGDAGDTAPTNGFEICTTVCKAPGASGSNAGQFVTNQPTRVAVDSTGVIYTVEAASPNFQLQTFTPSGPGLVPNNRRLDAVRGAGVASSPTDVAIGAADHVFVAKQCTAALCPDAPAATERRSFELDTSTPARVLDSHMRGAAVTSVTGLAVDATRGRVYVGSSTTPGEVSGPQLLVLDDVLAPVATVAPVSDLTATTATLNGSVNPTGSFTAYRFELSGDGGGSWTPLSRPDVAAGSGSSPVVVRDARVGLEPNTAYQARLVATKPFGNPSATSAPVAFTTARAPPRVTVGQSTASPSPGDESVWTAVLRGRVDPQGLATTYRFEWGATTAYGANAPVPDGSAGAGNAFAPVSAVLDGLAPGTTYHYRFVAAKAEGTTNGPDRTLATGPALPDGRVYEMVSPPDKNGAGVLISTQRARTAVQGDAILYSSLVGFGDVRGTGVSVDYMAVRHGGGWATHAITPRQDPQPSNTIALSKEPIYEGELSPDLSTGVVRANPSLPPLTAGAPNVAKVQNLYVRRDLRTPGDGTYTLMSDAVSPQGTNDINRPDFGGASADFRHVAFDTRLNLTADASGTGVKAYEWADGAVRLAGVLPDGRAAASSSVEKGFGYWHPHGVSADGSRVLFTSPAGVRGNLYMRVDGATTVQLNRSERAVPDAPQSATFQTESADGTRVFFTTLEKLVDGDDDTCVDLYLYDASLPDGDPHNLVRISTDQEPADGLCADVGGVVGTSRDGTTAYFLATRQLVLGAPLLVSAPLFVWRDGQLRYVSNRSIDFADDVATANLTTAESSARVTPDGAHVLFSSSAGAGLTGYDHGSCPGGGCRELYVYSADADGGAGRLACASCRPDGEPATRDAGIFARVGDGGANSSAHLNRAISDDGRRAFFHTAEALVPQDRNDVSDVYEYDTVAGQLDLITPGAPGARDAFLLDASASGDDVFFASVDRLSAWDVDAAYDVYDARVGGGLPDPPALVTPCEGSACQGGGSAAPAAPAPGTATFAGPSGSALLPSGGLLPVFRALPLGERQLRRFARRGRAVLLVHVSEAGRVRAIARARVGGRLRRVAFVSRDARDGGTVRVPLALSPTAERQLRRSGRLRLSIAVTYSKELGRERMTVMLRRPAAGSAAARGGRS